MDKPQVNDAITVKINGEEEEIFMSFGLLNLLTKSAGGIENVGYISLDHSLRTEVLETLLAKRNRTGKVLEERKIEDTEISLDDVDRLLEWGTEHILCFFVRQANLQQNVQQKYQSALAPLMNTQNGSQD